MHSRFYSARRNNFAGQTDKYALNQGSAFGMADKAHRGDRLQKLTKAKTGIAPFDPIGGLLSDSVVDASETRLAKYETLKKFYQGEHFVDPFENGDVRPVFNFCEAVVDKGVDFFVADGWTISAIEGNENIADLLNTVWEASQRKALTQAMMQCAGIAGDIFVYVTVLTHDKKGNPIPVERKNEWRVRISLLNPSYCFPIYDPRDMTKLQSMLIQYPVLDGENVKLFSMVITDEEFSVFLDGDKKSTQPNPFGKINVVHHKNMEEATSLFGKSDIESVIPLNREYNATANSLRKIIKYHGEPTTVIYGARASTMEKGANKLWSNLPVDARIENLELKAQPEALINWLEKLQSQIYQIASMPKIVFDNDDFTVTNTSGIAIQMLYQPIVEKTQRKRVQHTKTVNTVNELILIAEQEIIGTDVLGLADYPDRLNATTINYTSTLPHDEVGEIDSAVKLLNAKGISQAEFVRRVCKVKDTRRNALELAADNMQALTLKFEEAKAVLGEVPSPLVGFLGSVSLGEDFVKLAEELAKKIDNKENEED